MFGLPERAFLLNLIPYSNIRTCEDIHIPFTNHPFHCVFSVGLLFVRTGYSLFPIQ